MKAMRRKRLGEHDPWGYLKNVLTRLSTQLNSRIEELLPHHWHNTS